MAMRIEFAQHGDPGVLAAAEFQPTAPDSGEVRVAVHAAGLNYIDTYHRTGYYPVPGLPSGIGVEGAGIVESVGPGVSDWKAGDRVAWVVRKPGSYAENVTLAAAELVRVPDEVSLKQAAAMMLKGMTARYLLRQTYPVRSGDTILVQAAAGGVGLILCQWAAWLGATVIGTVGSEEKAELAKANGCHHPIQYRSEDVAARVDELTSGEGVAVAYDSVGRTTFEGSLASLRQRGLLVSFGQSSGAIEAFDPGKLAQGGSLYLTRPSLFHYIDTPESLAENAHELFEAVTSGRVQIDVRQEFSLADAADAHRALESRATTGSTVLLTRHAE